MNLSSEEIERELLEFINENDKKQDRVISKPKQLQAKTTSRKNKQLQEKFEDLKLYILKIISQDGKLDRIKIEKGWSDSRLSNYTRKLKDEGLIIKAGYGSWNLTQKGYLYLSKNKPEISIRKPPKLRPISTSKDSAVDIHVHSLRIKFELLEDNSDPSFWNRKSDMAYTEKYFHYSENMTIEKTSKSIILHIDFNISLNDPKLLDGKLSMELIDRINSSIEVLESNGIAINRKLPMDINVEYGIETPITRNIRKFLSASSEILDLRRMREKLFAEGLEQEAWSKIDASHGRGIDTSDLLYIRKLLEMPETVDSLSKSMIPVLGDLKEVNTHLAINIKEHYGVLGEMKLTLSDIRNELRIKRELDIIEKPDDPENIDLNCPFCDARFSKKLLLKRKFICPNDSCYRDLRHWFSKYNGEKPDEM